MAEKKHIVVLTGAGISAESGIATFRDSDGLWENHSIDEVASPEGWYNNPKQVLDFYNQRRKQLSGVEPNAAHKALAKLESKYTVDIITQNVDDLHERGGSSRVLHIHGELKKARSTGNPKTIVTLTTDTLALGDCCPEGYQLRPHIVWFGEEVSAMEDAAKLVHTADVLMVIGTSLQVYPAAGLLYYAPVQIPKYLIDPKATPAHKVSHLTIIPKTAVEGVPALVDQFLQP
ncbi:MAG: NAD-dependent deacylase [Bacteroidales bacterium]|nr:NAD-dependent deacylase [Bacteroidales bacterium]HPE86238.1 NAD-dependent deacylase [Bacteroidales bacterium]